MIALGIDLASAAVGTAACTIRFSNERIEVGAPVVGCADQQLDQLIGSADVIGIDAPFGWPTNFQAAVADWRYEEWTPQLRKTLQFRTTDMFVIERTGLFPLSVSSDRIALPAMRAMSLLVRNGVTDKSGDGRFFEVYPAASLKSWLLPCRGYKKASAEGRAARERICEGLAGRFAVAVPDICSESDHALDAVIASLTAMLAARGKTVQANAEQMPKARSEGWIHLPTGE